MEREWLTESEREVAVFIVPDESRLRDGVPGDGLVRETVGDGATGLVESPPGPLGIDLCVPGEGVTERPRPRGLSLGVPVELVTELPEGAPAPAPCPPCPEPFDLSLDSSLDLSLDSSCPSVSLFRNASCLLSRRNWHPHPSTCFSRPWSRLPCFLHFL